MDVKREVAYIDRQHAWQHRQVGETVMWYMYDRDASNYHELPGNEGTRRYKQGVPVPVFALNQTEGEQTQTEGGNLPVQVLHLTVPYKGLSRAGVTNPTRAEGHLYDVIYYDGNYYDIRRLHLLGRVRRDLIVAVDAVQIFPSQEWQFTAMLTEAPGIDPNFGQPGSPGWGTFVYGEGTNLAETDAAAMRMAVIGGASEIPDEDHSAGGDDGDPGGGGVRGGEAGGPGPEPGEAEPATPGDGPEDGPEEPSGASPATTQSAVAARSDPYWDWARTYTQR